MKCYKCASEMADDYSSCPNCGAKSLRGIERDISGASPARNGFLRRQAQIMTAGAPSVGGKGETLVSWLGASLKSGIRNLPKHAATLAIQLGIFFIVNLLFWWLIDPYMLPAPLDKIASAIIFLTATYNDVIPKAIYWVLIFTFFKRLFLRARREGIKKAVAPLGNFIPSVKAAYSALERKSLGLLLAGGGLGLAIANYFASYSRFPQARNKFDKYFVALAIAFAIAYSLGEHRRKGVFKFLTLLWTDLRRLVRLPARDVDNSVTVVMFAFGAGLLLDAPLIAIKSMYGGFILGAILVVGGTIKIIMDSSSPGRMR